jgi:hypothetical protein
MQIELVLAHPVDWDEVRAIADTMQNYSLPHRPREDPPNVGIADGLGIADFRDPRGEQRETTETEVNLQLCAHLLEGVLDIAE